VCVSVCVSVGLCFDECSGPCAVQCPCYVMLAYGLWGEGLVWLIGAVVCLLAADRGPNCSLTRAMDGRILHCGIISLCQSAATSEIVKHFWSRV